MKELTGKQRRYLRGLGHSLKPVVQIGKDGMTSAIVKAVHGALEDHELIKIRILDTCDANVRTLGPKLAKKTQSHLVQTLGHTGLLYRRRKEEPEIRLPVVRDIS